LSRNIILKNEHLLKRKAELLVQRLNNEDNKLTVKEFKQDESDEESEDLYSSCEEKSSESKVIKNEQLSIRKSNRESRRSDYLRNYDCNVIEKMCLTAETESSLSFKKIMTSKDADQ